MPIALCAVKDVTYGGVYYTSSFTMSGAITWTKLTTTGLPNTLIAWFRVDPFYPVQRQYVCLDNGDMYGRNAGNWSLLLSAAQAAVIDGATGFTNSALYSPFPDPENAGVIYVAHATDSSKNQSAFVLKSTDYGANWALQWTPTDVSTNQVGGEINAADGHIWYALDKNIPPNYFVYYTPNDGTNTYGNTNIYKGGVKQRYPWNKAQAYGSLDSTSALGIYTYAAGAITQTTGPNIAANLDVTGSGSGEVMWVDPYTDLHERILDSSGANMALLYTTDQWATYNTTALGMDAQTIAGHLVHSMNSGSSTALAFTVHLSIAGVSKIYAMSSETGTPVLRNGANSTAAPYTDSVPSNLQHPYYPLWFGEVPVTTGVYVYADEQESDDGAWASDISDYSKLGSPMGGDRASFRDMDADNLAVYHAQDIHAGTPQRHNPWPASSGQAPVSDGTKYVATDIATQAELNTHAGLNIPNVHTGTWDAHKVLAGPTSGGAATPTIRLLSLADGDVADVNITGDGQGDILYQNAGTYEDYPMGVGTDIANDGNSIKIGNIGAGNYIQIDTSTGEIALAGDATAWDDLRVSASIAKPGATAPNYKAFGPSGNLQALMFEASHHDEVFFEVQMPHNWKVGSDIHPHVHWTPTTADAGNVVWELEYSWCNIDGTFGAPSNMATDATAAGGTAWVHKMSDFKTGGVETISGLGKTLSSMLVCRLHRNSNSGSDTLNKDVALLEIDFHYEIDSFGSFDETTKTMTSNLLLETGDALLLETGDKLLLE